MIKTQIYWSFEIFLNTNDTNTFTNATKPPKLFVLLLKNIRAICVLRAFF